MRVKEGFILREVMGRKIVVSTGAASKTFSGMIKLNDTAEFIWLRVAEGCSREEIVQKLTEEYDVTPEKARLDTDALCDKMITNGIWES